MAIAPTNLNGTSGSVSVDGTVINITKWDLTLTASTYDGTDTGDGGWAHPECAIKSAKGSFTANWKVASGAPSFVVGDIYPVIFTVKTGQDYSFSGLVTSVAPSLDVKGGVTFKADVESVGEVTTP